MKIYILKKDTPDASTGTRFILRDNSDFYYAEYAVTQTLRDGTLKYPAYPKSIVEYSPEWFYEEINMLDNIVSQHVRPLPIYQSHKFSGMISESMRNCSKQYLREILLDIKHEIENKRVGLCSENIKIGIDSALKIINKYLKS